MTDDLARHATMAKHAGACEALLAACRLLRLADHRDAANLIIDHISALVPAVETLPAHAGEGEV